MYSTFLRPYEQDCDCRCPAHRGQPRLTYNDSNCHCLITCATQPLTLLAPEVGGALFLNFHGTLWFVSAPEPGHWDWRHATPVDVGHRLLATAIAIADALHSSSIELQRFRHH
ncbi:hypothetical protein [Asanoa iriomotensis]|uniref:Uncharacterized protein n=1 Tax=Asanoa iriomotensis TaxID=234613 RepID=A0ABQ4C1H0_9ACTN|nr:hypothetical protein [Asanoa iriomotensis]GIF56622.1 hypothetical protein Air01nite_27170 [Asanoa iriomotensis]